MRRFAAFLAALFVSSVAYAQSYPSPVFQGLTSRGCTGYMIGNGVSPVSCAPTIPGSGLATGAAVANLGFTPANRAGDTFTGAVTIPFTQAGTGAASRTADAKLKDVFSAADFCTDKTGATDCTTSLQAAETALETAGGGTLFFPAGTYKISSCLTIAGSNISWKGAGAGGTRLILSGATQNGICLNGSDVHSIEIAGLQIENSNVPPTGGFMIYFANTNVFDVKIHDLTTFRCYVCIGTDIQTPGTTGAIMDVSLTNFEFRDTRFGGIQAQAGIGWKISKGVISFANPQTVAPPTNSFGIRLADWVDGIWLTDINVLGGDVSMMVNSVFGSNPRPPAQIFATNLALDSGWNTSLTIQDAHEFNFIGGALGNLSGGNAAGAQISGGTGIKFTGTVFANINKGCINYTGGTYVSFDSISLVSCSRASSGTYHGIYVGPNLSYWAIRNSNGRVDTSWYGSNGQGYSVFIDSGNNHFVATNNLLTGVTGGLFNGSSGAAVSTVSGNIN